MSTRPAPEGLDFLVNRADWHQHRLVEPGPPAEPEPGQALFRVDRFAFTANNISYALSGDMLGYWRFFPTEEGWGRIPTTSGTAFSTPVIMSRASASSAKRWTGSTNISARRIVKPHNTEIQCTES